MSPRTTKAIRSLKSRRVAIGMTAAELARRICVDRSSVSYWESGQRRPSASHLKLWRIVLERSENARRKV